MQARFSPFYLTVRVFSPDKALAIEFNAKTGEAPYDVSKRYIMRMNWRGSQLAWGLIATFVFGCGR